METPAFTPLNPYVSRWYSAFKGLCYGNLATLAYLLASMASSGAIPFSWPFCVVLPALGALAGILRPGTLATPPSWTKRIAVGFGVVATAAGVIAIGGFLFAASHFMVKTFKVSHATYAEYRVAAGDLLGGIPNTMVPPTATDIRAEGALCPFADSFDSVCTVSEADFLAFAKAHGYVLAENSTTCNAYPMPTNSPPVQYDWSSSLHFLERTMPASYWSYANIRPSDGGTRLLYDRTAHRLYGAYSSN